MGLTDEQVKALRNKLNNSNYLDNAINIIADKLIEDEIQLRPLKHCSWCDTWQSIDEFYNSKNAPGGKYCYCRTCVNIKRRAYESKVKTHRLQSSE